MRSLRWSATVGWTALTLYLMLSPGGDSTVIERLSRLTGGSDLAEAGAHLALFGVLAALWYVALTDIVPARKAMYLASLTALVLGVGTEVVQSLIHRRGGSFADLVTDGVGVSIALALARWRTG